MESLQNEPGATIVLHIILSQQTAVYNFEFSLVKVLRKLYKLRKINHGVVEIAMTKETRDKPEKADLSKVNSRLARRILGFEVPIAKPLHIEETAQVYSMYDKVGKQIEFCENAVNSELRDLRNKTILDLGVTGMTVIFFGVALIWSNLNGVIAAAGLGGTNLYAQGKSWQDTVVTYWKDRTNLKIRVDDIKRKYASCTSSDESGLKEVQDLVDAFFRELTSASKSEK